MIGCTRATATSRPLTRPEAMPIAMVMATTVKGPSSPLGSSQATMMALVRPARGPTERSIPPLPESTGAACAMAVRTKGVAAASTEAQFAGSMKEGLAAALRATSTAAPSRAGQA
jgi:hypothetical protein